MEMFIRSANITLISVINEIHTSFHSKQRFVNVRIFLSRLNYENMFNYYASLLAIIAKYGVRIRE